MKETIVVYHWWGDEKEQPIYSNMSHPIILSISSLRAVNPTIKIIVLNCSKYNPSQNELEHFKEKLNFDILPINFTLEEHYSKVKGYQLLSRLFDIRKIDATNQIVIYCDSDVFWLKDPLPLECDPQKFCFDGFNSGFFYYDYDSPLVKEMFSVFDAYSITALRDKSFCKMIKEKTNYDAWPYIWDETVLRYMNENGMDHLFNVISINEHGAIRNINLFDKNKMKMLHCNGLMIKNPTAKRLSEKSHSRGLACLIFKEFYENICKSLDTKDINMIFTKNEIMNCLSQQISLFDCESINQKKCNDGTYEITINTSNQWFI